MKTMETEESSLIGKVAGMIARSKRLIVFTGAGVSTESGIPDFRSPDGIWSKYDPEEFTLKKFLSSPQSRKLHWKMLIETGMFMTEAKPNAAHYAIAELYKMGKLDCIITQNVDDLHQKAGVPRDMVFELHGNLNWVKCLGCGQRYPMSEIKERLKQEKKVPDCLECQGILKPTAVFFGEALPEEVLNEATYHCLGCDLFLVIGSTLVVYPAANMPLYAKDAGADLVIINLSPTPLDSLATVTIQGKAGEVMAEVLKQMKE